MYKDYSKYITILIVLIIVVSITIFLLSIDNYSTININWSAVITTGTSIILLVLKWFYEKWSIDKNNKKQKIKNKKHPIFSLINEIFINELKNFDLGNRGRTTLFKYMISEQIKAYEEEIKKFIDYKFTSNNDFREKARLLILTSAKNYERRWVEGGVPDLVIEKYKFLQKDKIVLLLSDIDTITFYRLSEDDLDYEEVVFYLLTYISGILKLSISLDTVKILKSLNGELSKLKFNGLEL